MKPCCPHPVGRHAYNGCADCACNVSWIEHPDRESDPEFPSIVERRIRAGIPVGDLYAGRRRAKETR